MKQPREAVVVYTDELLLSVLLNHRYPDHNVRKMIPHCRLETHGGTVVLFVPDDVEKENRPHRSR